MHPQELELTRCLHQVDPILQFLTRATGHDRVPLPYLVNLPQQSTRLQVSQRRWTKTQRKWSKTMSITVTK
jgi:hypothetical protein